MKKTTVLIYLILAGFIFVYSGVVTAKDNPKEEKGSEAKKTEESRVVCKFKTKDEMREFEKLYAAKQATFGRMGVLQAYFSMEQDNLKEINNQIDKKFKFKMNPDKMYDLNRESMEIREAGDIPQKPKPAQQ